MSTTKIPDSPPEVNALRPPTARERFAAEGVSSRTDEWRWRSTEELLAEAECWRWEFAALRAAERAGSTDPYLANGVAYIMHHLAGIAAELERRERLRAEPEAPPWPDRYPDAKAEAERLAAQIPLETFVERYLGVPLERRGDKHVGRCMLGLHDDSSPSFTIYPNGRGWFCFGCGQGGTFFTLMFLTIPGLRGYRDAAELLRDWSGLR